MRKADELLNDLQESLLAMSRLVEGAIGNAVDGLLDQDSEKIASVEAFERHIDAFQKSIDEMCVRLLAMRQPAALDLRQLVAAIKVNGELERMGDQAVNIARNASHCLKSGVIDPREVRDLLEMVLTVRSMVHDVLDAYVRRDAVAARHVLLIDDKVDSLKARISQDLVALMKTSPEVVDGAMSLILIARNLEKIGDHVTNIAEDIVFVVTGEDIRHASATGGDELREGAITTQTTGDGAMRL